MASLLDRLPRGRTLPPEIWAKRHALMMKVLWAHVVGLMIFALARGYDLPHTVLHVLPIVAMGLVARVERLALTARAIAVTVGLLTASAILVHVWDGRIEAHFHFFVMVTLLATYEAWGTYLLAIAFVALHHGAVGLIASETAFDHPGGRADPWLWAGIHALFIVGLAAANIIGWRLNEDVRDKMRRNERRFLGAFDEAPIGMAIVGLDGTISRVNGELAARTGFTPAELQEMKLSELLAPEERTPGVQWPSPGLDGEPEERRYVRQDGTTGWALWQHAVMTGQEDGRPVAYITHVIDISKRRHAERQLDFQAHHDALTGLPNRKLFVENLERALADRGRDRTVAVLFVDLDNFKLVNDSLGHGAGDRLLTALGDRMRRVLRPDDVIARFGGDEFAVLVRSVGDAKDAGRVADRIAGSLRAPVVLDGEQRFVTASIGICVAPRGDDVDAGTLLRDADAAMYRAKDLGKARCEVFDDSLRAQVVERVEFEAALRGASDRGELRLDYQPFIDLNTGRITGAEALLRWDHPELGTIAPLRFIPIAEQSGLIVPIGAWVLREACGQAAAWTEASANGAALEMAVNVSPRQLASSAFVDDVRGALVESGLPAHRLCLEVTESAVIADIETAGRSLERLKKLGVRLAIDDFGVGYASLGQLKALPPVDVLKIDRSFISGVLGDQEDKAIVDAVIQLAASLGLQTVAEGVETSDQASLLRAMQCRTAQGYHFARPVAPSGIVELLGRQDLGELVQ